MQTEIYVRHGLKKRMSEELGFCKNTIRAALLGLTQNENARLIRKRAIGFYGGIELKSGLFCSGKRAAAGRLK